MQGAYAPFLMYGRRKPEVAEPGADRRPCRDCLRVRGASDTIHSNHAQLAHVGDRGESREPDYVTSRCQARVRAFAAANRSSA